jgi:NitT/TauT family transport system substrate-binding protein
VKHAGRSVIALRRWRPYAALKQEKMMSRGTKKHKAVLDRRTLLGAGAAAAFAAPMGMFGAQAFPFRAAAPNIDFSEFPICKASSDAPPLIGAPRKLKLSWNAGAVCLAPLPVINRFARCERREK